MASLSRAVLCVLLIPNVLAYRAKEVEMGELSTRNNASLGSIATLDWANTAGEWTFFYKEWCPFTQNVFQMLKENNAMQGFIKRVGAKNMRCFSSFEDGSHAIVHQKLAFDWVGKLVFNVFSSHVDPNDGRAKDKEIKCDAFFETGESPVRAEGEAAYYRSHDSSCGRCTTCVPAIVIGGKKYCESGEIKDWLEKNVAHFKPENDVSLEKGPEI